MATEPTWTEDEDNELKRLLEMQQYSNAQVAALLSEKFTRRTFTRSAIIGRIHRIEKACGKLLRKRRGPSFGRTERVKREKPHNPSPKPAQPKRTAAVFNTIKDMGEVEELPNPIAVKVKLPPVVLPVPDTPLCTLDDLKNGMCRWPFGDIPPYMFCGQRVEKGSFCAKHSRLGYTEPKPRNRRPTFRR